jgi:hypothetical protein
MAILFDFGSHPIFFLMWFREFFCFQTEEFKTVSQLLSQFLKHGFKVLINRCMSQLGL